MRYLGNFLAITVLLSYIFGCGSSSTPKLKVDLPQTPLIVAPKQSINISNEGEENSKLKWRVDNIPSWLIASPRSGEITAGEEAKVDLNVSGSVPKNVKQASVTVNGGEGGSITFEVFLGCATTLTAKTTQTTLDTRKPENQYVPKQLIVSYKETTELTTLQNLVTTMESTYGYRTLSFSYTGGPNLIEVEGNLEDTAAKLRSDPNVDYVDFNFYIDILAFTPNDSFFTHQWNMKDFGMEQAWEIETGAKKGNNAPVVIAILDSAVQTDHEDLKDKMLPGCDFHDNDSDPSSPIVNADTSHGTHVAGIAAAVGNNNLGVVGVAFGDGAEILPVKIFADNGTGGDIFNLANAIRWSVGLEVTGYVTNPNPAKILNISLGTPGKKPTLDDAVADAVNAGALVFAASGNAEGGPTGNGIFAPANSPGALAIGSVDSNFERSSFSHFDETGGKSVDLMGPGGFLTTGKVFNCTSRNSSAVLSTFPTNNYSCLAGTSMSSPFVAGVAALIWNQNPNFSAQQVKNRLVETTFFDNSWGTGKSFEHGFGVVCADKALGGTTLCGK